MRTSSGPPGSGITINAKCPGGAAGVLSCASPVRTAQAIARSFPGVLPPSVTRGADPGAVNSAATTARPGLTGGLDPRHSAVMRTRLNANSSVSRSSCRGPAGGCAPVVPEPLAHDPQSSNAPAIHVRVRICWLTITRSAAMRKRCPRQRSNSHLRLRLRTVWFGAAAYKEEDVPAEDELSKQSAAVDGP